MKISLFTVIQVLFNNIAIPKVHFVQLSIEFPLHFSHVKSHY